MFGFSDFLSLLVSVFIIWPTVALIRESGYILISALFGVKNPRLTIGSGPRVFKKGMLDFRKYYHLYSWYSYDSLKKESKTAYTLIYAGPIIVLLTAALLINYLVAVGVITEYLTFWDRFLFYAFFYLLFDVIPMKTVNGKPNNGMIIYEMVRYGKRTDYNHEPFIPATTEVEKEYQEEMKEIEKEKEQEKEAIEKTGGDQQDIREIEREKQEEKEELTEEKEQEKEELKEEQKEEKEEK